MIYYTGDLHFGHKNVLDFDHRPFSTVEEMDRFLIDSWNARVQDNDTVYLLGDFCYRSEHSPEWYLRQLRGKKILVLGNHDGAIMNSPEAQQYFEAIEKMTFLKDDGKMICLCHFPIAEWNGFYREAWHIYGHIHNRKGETYEIMKNRPRSLNAGCMINNYMPVTFRELVQNNQIFREGFEE